MFLIGSTYLFYKITAPVEMSTIMASDLLIKLAITIVVVIIALYVYLKKQYRFWKDHRIPGPEPTMLLGNMSKVFNLKVTESELMDSFYQDYKKEKYIGIYNLWDPTLLINDASLAKKIMETDFEYFTDHPDIVSHAQSDSILRSLFAMKGAVWKSRRQVFTKLFTPKKLKEYLDSMDTSLSLLMDNVDQNVGHDVQLLPLLERHFARTICTILYGLDVSNDENRIMSLNKCSEMFSKPPMSSALGLVFYSVSPKLFQLFKVKIYPTFIWNYFSSFSKELFSAKEKNNDVKRNDLLEMVMKMRETDVQHCEKITFEEAVGHIYVFFIASYHTSVITLCHIFLQLALHQEVQEKLREEVNSVLKGSKNITYEQLAQMTYMDAVIVETLRIHPLLGVLKRTCTKNYQIDEQFTVPKGMNVFITIGSMHMDPNNFAEPEKFKPERFQNKDRKTAAWMPFGRGPRTCIGMTLAEISMKVVLSRLLLDYSILPSEKMELPMKFDPQTLFFTSLPIGGFWYKLKRRC